MRVVVSGSTGLIGSALVEGLKSEHHEVLRLVRSAPKGSDEVRWDPAAGTIDVKGLTGIEGAVHLAGEGIGSRRWSAAQKRRILDSRVKGTRLLAETLAGLDPRPSVLVSGSAVGYYGLRGDEVLTEESGPGSGFLADVVRQWEAATAPAEQAGVRTVHVRTGIVLSARGGAMGRVLPLFRLGLGGKLGRGDQWWSWISLEDDVRLIVHLLTSDVSGAVNATAPEPVTNAEFTRTLAKVLGRPALLAVPKFAIGLVMGRELTEEVVMAGQRALPAVAEKRGFVFRDRDVETALRHVLSK